MLTMLCTQHIGVPSAAFSLLLNLSNQIYSHKGDAHLACLDTVKIPGDDSSFYYTVKTWIAYFMTGKENTEHDPLSDRPNSAITEYQV